MIWGWWLGMVVIFHPSFDHFNLQKSCWLRRRCQSTSLPTFLPSQPSSRHDQHHHKQVGRHPEARDQENDPCGRKRLLLALDVSLVGPVAVRFAAKNPGARNAPGNRVAAARHDDDSVMACRSRWLRFEARFPARVSFCLSWSWVLGYWSTAAGFQELLAVFFKSSWRLSSSQPISSIFFGN